MSALPFCGGAGSLGLWTPYALEEPLRQEVSNRYLGTSVDECVSKNSCSASSARSPGSLKELQACGECASSRVPLNQYYGCNWCQSVWAPLSAYHGTDTLVWSLVTSYFENSTVRDAVTAHWNGLTQCEKGTRVKRSCLTLTDPGFPWRDPQLPTSASGSSGLSVLEILGLVVLSVFAIGLMVFLAKKFKSSDSGSSIQAESKYERYLRVEDDHFDFLSETQVDPRNLVPPINFGDREVRERAPEDPLQSLWTTTHPTAGSDNTELDEVSIQAVNNVSDLLATPLGTSRIR